MPNPATVLENDSHKFLWDFDVQTDHLISTRKPDLTIMNNNKKRIFQIVDFGVPVDYRIKRKKVKRRIST